MHEDDASDEDDDAWEDDDEDASASSSICIMDDDDDVSASSSLLDGASASSSIAFDDASASFIMDEVHASASFSTDMDDASTPSNAVVDASPSTASPSWDYPANNWVEFATKAATLWNKDGPPPGTNGHDRAFDDIYSCFPPDLFDAVVDALFCWTKILAMTARYIPMSAVSCISTGPIKCKWAMTLLDYAQGSLDVALERVSPSPTTIKLQLLIDTVCGELDKHLYASLHILQEDAAWTQARSIGNAPSFDMEDTAIGNVNAKFSHGKENIARSHSDATVSCGMEDPADNQEEDGTSFTVGIGKTNTATYGISDAIRLATPHHSTYWEEDNAAMTAQNNADRSQRGNHPQCNYRCPITVASAPTAFAHYRDS